MESPRRRRCLAGHAAEEQGYVLDSDQTWCEPCGEAAGIRIDLADVENCYLDLRDGTDPDLLDDGAFRAPDWWTAVSGAREQWPMLDALLAEADDLRGAHWEDLPSYFPSDMDGIRTFLRWLRESGVADVREVWRELQDGHASFSCLTLYVRLRAAPGAAGDVTEAEFARRAYL